jgi:hypothetical protein
MFDTVTAESTGVCSIDVLPVDRRAGVRFRLDLPIEYQVRGNPSTNEIITGTLVNLSSGGVLFRTDDPPPVKSELLVRLPWPENEAVHLELQITGETVWRRRNLTMVRIRRAEFARRG